MLTRPRQDRAVAYGHAPKRRNKFLACCLLALLTLLAYESISYGGIRSPDSEIVYRASEALVDGNGFRIERGLENWEGFGVAEGLDGGLYSIFGPGQSLAAAPLVAAGQRIADSGAFDRAAEQLPVSHLVENGLEQFAQGETPPQPAEHGKRHIASRLNVFVTALSVVLFFLVALRFTDRTPVAFIVALLYAFGTLTWPYAGTFFSEPLATMYLLASFYLLTLNDPRLGARRPGATRLFLAGLFVGLSVFTHISGILAAPFLLAYALHPFLRSSGPLQLLRPALVFAGGMSVFLTALGYHNLRLFGSVFETGRYADPEAARSLGYGMFTWPFEGLYGLTLSPQKGLLIMCPAVVLALFGWRRFRASHTYLADVLAGMIAFRILFIASRTDWHGGFCLGPRLLMMLVPFLCLPLIPVVAEVLDHGRRAWTIFMFGAWMLVCQQWYFSVGEVFSHYHLRKVFAEATGLNPFAQNRIFLELAGSPAFTLHEGFVGPYRLGRVFGDPVVLLILGVLGFAALMWALVQLTPEDALGDARSGIDSAVSTSGA